MYYVVKKYIFLQKTYTLKLPCEKKGIGRELAELENSKSPDNAPENFMAAKQTGNCSARKRVLGGGLRNWKTARARTMPRRISWLQSRQEIAPREKGYWKGTCGTGIGGYICQKKKVV